MSFLKVARSSLTMKVQDLMLIYVLPIETIGMPLNHTFHNHWDRAAH